ncbi:MAG: histidine phosphatase family protein [Verrucomicrobia bacterium]|jgi:broad specificity phosphatase PhoE|nr:histidine phosphatase family protein [Verrucomicrobiota bacterium]
MSAAHTRLILARHGEVEPRYQRVFGGRIDMGLSDHGHEQAARLADWLAGIEFAGVYVSPMKRARLTAAPLLARNGHDARFVEALREVDFGAWTGLTWEQVQERHQISAFDWLHALDRGDLPDAEPAGAFQRRVAGAVDDIIASHPGGTSLVLCHGGVIRAALAHLIRVPLPKTARFEIDYASVSIVEIAPHRAKITLLNYTPWRSLP